MKKIYSLVFVLLGAFVFSQNPAQLINYQGVARGLAGNPIIGSVGLKLELHRSTATGPIVFTESQTAVTNQFGIFNLQIGSQNTTGFAAIDWSQGPYFLEVSMDPNGGTSYTSISNQQLVSVPYALYAENAKNATTTSITAAPGITVTNLGVNNFSLNAPNYVAGSNVTITPLTNNDYKIDAGASSTASPLSPWTTSVNNVYLSNSSNLVGIGIPNPAAKLDVNTTTNSAMDAIYATTGTGNGVVGSVASTATSIAGVKGLNGSVGPGVYGKNNAGGTGVYGENVTGSASANAHGVDGKTNSQGLNSAGVLGENYGMGPGVYGYQGGSSSSSNAYGVQGISNSTGAAGVYGLNNSGNAGVYGLANTAGNSTNANGVKGETSSGSNLANGVYGVNMGNGNGVYGLTSSSLTTSKGVFGKNVGGGDGVYGETGSSFPSSAAVAGYNSGMGPALKGSLPTGTVAGGTNLSLFLENGHIKSGQPNQPTVSTFSISGGITGSTYTLQGCTDVKGNLMAVATTTGLINVGGQLTIRVDFVKPYTVVPVVVVSPTSDLGPMSYFVSSVTLNSFNVTFKNSTPTNIPGSLFNFNFNYFVIE